ncbi:MAG: hypothetical protein HRU15_03570 [Planctomycetes bacterium]|nr:hypothetical protein [Planctomycetota bacterium]
MLELLFFQQDTDVAFSVDEIVEVCQNIEGVVLEGKDQDAYRPGIWRDPWTHARCVIDIGVVNFDHDDALEEKNYEHWQQVPLHIKIPLSCPHWHCVESLRMVEDILQALKNVFIIDTEDSIDGPVALDRMRCLSSWEQLHHAQTESRGDMFRMNRTMSVALWRYRRELSDIPEDENWPQAFVLLDGERARSAVMWQDPERDVIFPPVELIIVQRGSQTGVIPSDELITCATHINNLDKAGAVMITSDDLTTQLFNEAKLLPTERFKSLSDDEWSD